LKTGQGQAEYVAATVERPGGDDVLRLVNLKKGVGRERKKPKLALLHSDNTNRNHNGLGTMIVTRS
jgi:hypothetical protein